MFAKFGEPNAEDKHAKLLENVTNFLGVQKELLEVLMDRMAVFIALNIQPITYSYLSDLIVISMLDILGADTKVTTSLRKKMGEIVTEQMSQGGSNDDILNQDNSESKPLESDTLFKELTPEKLEKLLGKDGIVRLLSKYYDGVIDKYLDKKKKLEKDKKEGKNDKAQ